MDNSLRRLTSPAPCRRFKAPFYVPANYIGIMQALSCSRRFATNERSGLGGALCSDNDAQSCKHRRYGDGGIPVVGGTRRRLFPTSVRKRRRSIVDPLPDSERHDRRRVRSHLNATNADGRSFRRTRANGTPFVVTALDAHRSCAFVRIDTSARHKFTHAL